MMTNLVPLPKDTLLHHWQGHRQLTRRTIQAFPDDKLFTYTPAPSLRPFGMMMLEVIGMIAPTLQGLETGTWSFKLSDLSHVSDKATLLQAWDESDLYLEDHWAQIKPEALLDVVPPLPHLNGLLYLVENEVHHRAQGFVYLRLLGIEPPAFHIR